MDQLKKKQTGRRIEDKEKGKNKRRLKIKIRQDNAFYKHRDRNSYSKDRAGQGWGIDIYIYIYINSRGLQFILVGSPFSLDWSLCGDLHPLLSTVHFLGMTRVQKRPPLPCESSPSWQEGAWDSSLAGDEQEKLAFPCLLPVP